MTGNSSKFFRKILKTGLVTASGAAIMLSSSGALGAAARTTANNGVNLATGVNLGEAAAVFTPGSTLQFTGVHTVTAMNINVGAVDMNNFAGGPATITKSIGLGSVVDNVAANKLNVSINNGVTLTLTGTGDGGLGFVGGGNAAANDYTALGNITLGGATAGLTINSATPALITLTGTIDGAGNLLVSTPTDFTAAIGATTPLGAVTFNNGNGLNAATAKAITATTVTIGKDAANNASAVSTGKIGGAVNFTADGQLTVDGGITGAVTTAANDEGTLIVTAGNVADIGVGAPLKQVTFNGVSILNGVIDAKTITINGAVTANVGAITGNVNITSGTLTTNQVITGDLDVSGTGNLAGDAAATDVAGTVTLQAGATGAVTIHDALNAAVVMTEGGTLTLRKAAGGIKFTGTAIAGTIINVVDDVASNVGDVNNDAANGAGTGILNFLGAGTAGTIGANNSLAEVNFKGAGAVAITGTSNATTFTVGDAGADVTATGLMTGKVAFTADGQLTLGNGITGAVTTAANNTGKLIVTAGDVGGAIGTNGVNILNSVTFNGASNVTTIDATTVAIGAGGDVKTTGAVTADVNFTGDGQLTVGAGGITGAVTTAINDEGTLIVTAGDIQPVGGVGKSLKQVTFNGASTLNGAIDAQTITINGAVTAKVGAITGNVNITSGTLDTNQDITGNLNVSGGGNLAGVVGTTNITETVTLQATAGNVAINNAIGNVAVAGGTLNLAVAAGDMTITGGTVTQTDDIVGNLTVSGAGNLAGAVGATNVGGTVTLQPGATGIVTIKDALNAAAVSVAGGTLNIHNAAGGINFTGNADATVNVAAGGDVGAVNNTTKIDGIGILNFTDAGDAGAVGATNSLKEVRFSGAGVVTLGAVTATNINFANAAVVNANGNITANIDFKNNDGVIILDDGVNITGTVGSTLGVNGTLSFLGSSTVTETIGGAAGIAKLELIQAKGNGGNVVDFNKDVFVTDLKFTPVVIGPASTIKIGGNLTGNVTFYAGNNNGGILEFNGNAVDAAGDPIVYKFDGDIAANADKGTLNVNTTLLIATSATVTGLKEINIVNTKALAIDASNGDVTLPAVQTIAFAGANSGLGFSNTGNRDNAKIIFSGDFVPANDGQGRITFASADPNDIGGAVPKALTIISDNPANIRKIGTAAVGGKKFANLSVFDQVIVDKTIDLSGIAELDVINGANFVDQGATSAAIQIINIGADGGAGTGPATHTIDVSTAAAVNLLGDNVKFADAGSTFKLQNTVAGNKTVTLANNIEGNVANGAGGIVELNADFAGGVSILTIDGGGGAGKSLGTAANKLQTLIFSGNGEIKLINKATFNAINLNLGVTAIELGDIVQHLEFSGDTTLTETGDIASVDFKGFNAVINMDPGKNITGTVTNTGVATNNGTIEFKGTGSIGGNISGLAMLKVGAGAVELKTGGATKITEIQGTGTDTLTLPENFKLTGAINSTGGLAVKLNFKGGTNSISGVVGTAANPVGGITTAGTTTFTSAVNSKGPITTAGNTTFSNSLNNIGDVTTSGTTIFTGAYTNTGTAKFGGTTNFASTFNNTGAITTTGTTTYTGAYTNKGTATFGGTTSFADTFNNTGAVTLAPGSINNFAKNVTATSFVASGATMNFSNSLAFNSSLTGSGTTINLGSGQLAYTGEGSFSDKLIIATTYEQAIPGGGNILIKAGSKLDLSQVNDLEIQFTAPGLTIDQINKNTKYQLIVAEASGGLVPTSANINFIVNGQEFTNAFVKWSIDTSSLTLSAKDVAEETIDEEFGPGGELENIPNATELEIAFREMENAPNGADAREALNNLGILTPIQRAEAGTHLLQNDTRPGVEASNITTQVVTSNITSNLVSVSARMDKISTGNQTQVKSPVSAGEEDDTSFGVWGSPFVGNSTQKMRNNVNGYKSTPNGGTVGFDALLNDDLVLGVAYTRANTKIKLKDTKVGDKTKVNSNIYSLYGLYNLPNNNWFFSAIASYGDSKMKSYSKRIVAVAPNTPGFQTAIGKYTSKSYTGQVMAGYNYLAPQDINLIPMVGLRYSNIKDKGYKETGATFQNLIVKGKNYNIVEGLAGAKVSTNVNVDQVILTPELYGLINYGFKNKAPAIDARLQGMDAPFPTNSFKSPKTSYNLGAGVTAKYQMMEYGINYDVNIASKYFAQQGSLKVRVNF